MSTDRACSPRKISDLIHRSKGVPANLYQHSLKLMVLQESIRQKLGSPLNNHFFLASISQDTVLIFTDSPVWATKLRFKTSTVLDIVRNISGQKHLKTVRIRINPSLTSQTSHDTPLSMSPATACLLGNVAANINDSAKLRDALLRLSQNKPAKS